MVWIAAVVKSYEPMSRESLAQINCGNVIVSPEDRVSDVKASIVSGNISKDKRKKSSKYALAVASSFGHVHAFLQDEDYVLDKIDQTTTEEKCLMLIKKPKSSSKKMFKSQSWANLSLSDSHLYNQPNYGTEGRKHKYRMKRKPSDLQTVPCESLTNLTDYGLRVDSYIPQQREIKNYNRCNGVASPKSCHSEDLSGRNGCMNGEINNNKLAKQSGSRMYSSHMDIYRNAPKLSYIQENSDKCVLRSDEMYNEPSDRNGHLVPTDPDSVSRAHSVGDLSTGLTLSVVGQRKADSVHNLATSKNSSFKPVSENNDKLTKTDRKLFSPTDNKKSMASRKCIQNKNDLQNTLRDLLTNISEKEKKAEKTPRNSSANDKREGDQTPVKPKRSLPSVPQGQANDRKKHYTEMVKQRMSQHSRSGGQSSSSGTSSSVRTVQDTPLDKEVSDLLGPERESCPGMLENVPYSENSVSNGANHSLHHDSLNVSIPSSLRSCDSGQATITSLSSTVDSGYLTNDAENDMYSSSSYMKSLQRSAQNLFSKKVPLCHSQSMYQESPRKPGSLQKESAIVKGQVQNNTMTNSVNNKHEPQKTATFPRSSQGQGQPKDIYQMSTSKTVSQESQKPKPQSCDNKLVKYSSMKNLTTSDFPSESQRSQGQNRNMANVKKAPVKSEHFFQHVQSLESKIKQEPPKEMIKQTDIKPLNSLPLTSPPKIEGKPPVIESHYNTLPGNWKFQNTEIQDENSGKWIPSLFQLSQTHKFIPVSLNVGLEFNLLDHIHLCENCVKLQNARKSNKRESTAMSPPQGKYARLGGPGSAFKPVKVNNTSVYNVVMVHDVSAVYLHKNLHKGDIVLEVNKKLVLGEPLKSIETLLSNSADEVLLTVARLFEKETSSSQTEAGTTENKSSNNKAVPLQELEKQTSNIMDSQVEHLKKQVARLTLELKRKTKAIRELNSLLPWRPNEDQSEINGNNEITLNGLSEDEFIV